MIKSITYSNFKGLRDCTLPLGPFNLLIGPNGSGKSSVLQSLEYLSMQSNLDYDRLVNRDVDTVQIMITGDIHLHENQIFSFTSIWNKNGRRLDGLINGTRDSGAAAGEIASFFDNQCKVYALDPSKITESVQLTPNAVMAKDGSNLAAALDSLRDKDENAFQQLRAEFLSWLPEFDNIVFDTPANGKRSFMLRLAKSKKTIPAKELSEGTIIALALLTICYLPNSPSVIGLEEPDRGIHPRLLRELRSALYRLSYPQDYGISRKPVQVIATTHSPIFLNLFKEHTEEIIVVDKLLDGSVAFKNLAQNPELKEILSDTSLGEAWYSGILGGVPAHT
jgi:predicted ATPase